MRLFTHIHLPREIFKCIAVNKIICFSLYSFPPRRLEKAFLNNSRVVIFYEFQCQFGT